MSDRPVPETGEREERPSLQRPGELVEYPAWLVYREDLGRLCEYAALHRLGDSAIAIRKLLDDALASSPSPPVPIEEAELDDLATENENLRQRVRDAESSPSPPDPEMIWVTRSSLEAVLSSPEREYPAYLVNDGEIVPAFTKAEAEALHKALTLGLTGSYDRLATVNDEGLNAARDKLRSLFDSVREEDDK